MWIKNEDGDILINTDKVRILYMELYYSNGVWKIRAGDMTIGTYTDEETCRKAFEGISKALRDGRGFYDMKEAFEEKVEYKH